MAPVLSSFSFSGPTSTFLSEKQKEGQQEPVGGESQLPPPPMKVSASTPASGNCTHVSLSAADAHTWPIHAITMADSHGSLEGTNVSDAHEERDGLEATCGSGGARGMVAHYFSIYIHEYVL